MSLGGNRTIHTVADAKREAIKNAPASNFNGVSVVMPMAPFCDVVLPRQFWVDRLAVIEAARAETLEHLGRQS